MKKTILFGMMSASVVFTACGVDDTVHESDDVVLGGMTLTATVAENGGTRAAIGDGENGTWKFAFTSDDEIKVRNTGMASDVFYTFTKGETTFTSSDAAPTGTAVDWYAYFPGTDVSLAGQNYTDKEGVAAKYALAGSTSESTDGKSGLSIELEPRVAVLVIKNHLDVGVDLNVKTADGKWVSGLKANVTEEGSAVFDVQTSDTKVTLLSSDNAGTYYVAVPAGVEIEIFDGDARVKRTKESGLTAGCYYTVDVNRLCLDAGHPHAIDLGLPSGTKWACCNVGSSSPDGYGGYYAWGETEEQEAKEGEPKVYTRDSYNYYKDGGYVKIGDDNGIISGTDYDVARVKMGVSWKMPTKDQYAELIANCTRRWVTLNNNNDKISGILVTSRNNGMSVFLPAAGYRWYGSLYSDGSYGYYWSGSLYPDNDSGAYYLCFYSGYWSWYNNYRYYGQSVRAVCP